VCYTFFGPNPVQYDCSSGTKACVFDHQHPKTRLYLTTNVALLCAGKPAVDVYNATDCSVYLASQDLSTSCAPTDDDGADDDDYLPPFIDPPPSLDTTQAPSPLPPLVSSQVSFCPQKAPTSMPVLAVTAFPTSATPVLLQFDVLQVLPLPRALYLLCAERCSLLNYILPLFL
jgi:hypothetical protein